jgi:hypothetical protein
MTETGRRETETEVTAEMIEAGKQELARFSPDFESEADAVARIFRAMSEAMAAVEELPA